MHAVRIRQAIWGHVWKCTVEKSHTLAGRRLPTNINSSSWLAGVWWCDVNIIRNIYYQYDRFQTLNFVFWPIQGEWFWGNYDRLLDLKLDLLFLTGLKCVRGLVFLMFNNKMSWNKVNDNLTNVTYFSNVTYFLFSLDTEFKVASAMMLRWECISETNFSLHHHLFEIRIELNQWSLIVRQHIARLKI